MALPQSKSPASFRKHVLTLLGEDYGDKTVCLCPTAFVRLFNGDHLAAILLAQILYWAERTKDPDGWFYKSFDQWRAELGLSEFQVRRILNGDKRVQTQRVTLRELGIETVVKKVKATGAPVTHFRVDQALFLAALEQLLGSGNSQQCPESIPNNVVDELSTESGVNPQQSARASDPNTKTYFKDAVSDDHSHLIPPHRDEDSDLAIFFLFEGRFGKIKAQSKEPLHTELARLGTERVGQVLERCATRGRSWNYVLRALANEKTDSAESQTNVTWADFAFTGQDDEQPFPEPQEAEPALPVNARVQTPWRASGGATATILDTWTAAFQQIEAQIDSATFHRCLRDATLVDFEPEPATLVVVVQSALGRDLLQGRLDRTVKRILGDVYGQPLAMRYLLKEDSLGQGDPREQSA